MDTSVRVLWDLRRNRLVRLEWLLLPPLARPCSHRHRHRRAVGPTRVAGMSLFRRRASRLRRSRWIAAFILSLGRLPVILPRDLCLSNNRQCILTVPALKSMNCLIVNRRIRCMLPTTHMPILSRISSSNRTNSNSNNSIISLPPTLSHSFNNSRFPRLPLPLPLQAWDICPTRRPSIPAPASTRLLPPV